VISLRVSLDDELARNLIEGRSVRLEPVHGGGFLELQLILHGGGLAQLLSAAAAAVAVPEANASRKARAPVKIAAKVA
jgi:hypothetical protein